MAGAVMGTPGYMAPQQARGEDVDERTDVFAVGAMLYEVLSATRPYAMEPGRHAVARHVARLRAEAVAGSALDRARRGSEAAHGLHRALEAVVVAARANDAGRC